MPPPPPFISLFNSKLSFHYASIKTPTKHAVVVGLYRQTRLINVIQQHNMYAFSCASVLLLLAKTTNDKVTIPPHGLNRLQLAKCQENEDVQSLCIISRFEATLRSQVRLFFEDSFAELAGKIEAVCLNGTASSSCSVEVGGIINLSVKSTTNSSAPLALTQHPQKSPHQRQTNYHRLLITHCKILRACIQFWNEYDE